MRARPGDDGEASSDRALTGMARAPGVATVRQPQAMKVNLCEVVPIVVNQGRDRLRSLTVVALTRPVARTSPSRDRPSPADSPEGAGFHSLGLEPQVPTAGCGPNSRPFSPARPGWPNTNSVVAGERPGGGGRASCRPAKHQRYSHPARGNQNAPGSIPRAMHCPTLTVSCCAPERSAVQETDSLSAKWRRTI